MLFEASQLGIGRLQNEGRQHEPQQNVLLGNPGIGKTFFGFCVLAHVAKTGGTVIYHTHDSTICYVFELNRVYKSRLDQLDDILDDSSVYYIVDSVKLQYVPACTLLVTSPDFMIWKQINKAGAFRRHMPVWDWDEFNHLRQQVFSRFDKYCQGVV